MVDCKKVFLKIVYFIFFIVPFLLIAKVYAVYYIPTLSAQGVITAMQRFITDVPVQILHVYRIA